LPVPFAAEEKIRRELKLKGWGEKEFLLIHSGARWDFKLWPAFRFIRLSQELVQKGHKLVFSASKDPSEKKLIRQITETLKPGDYLDLSGSLSLPELGALIKLSRLLFCMDSLPLHMASALKVKAVALFGPTQEKLWGPWQNEKALVLFENLSCRPCCQEGCGGSRFCECLYQLKEERVLEALEKLLETEVFA
ncbi:MAG: glycosyltransferase family 9 protein, partial [Parachlamydiales bacterium]|jgi:heptosyltransferase-3